MKSEPEQALGSASTPASSAVSMDELLRRIRSEDEATYVPACRTAVANGSKAVKPLLRLLAESDFELARRTKRALFGIVRHAGRPGAEREAREVERALITEVLTGTGGGRRDVLWILSEIGTARAVAPVALLLTEPELREDARCVLTRIPGTKATQALRQAFSAAPEDFKYALAESLRARGETVEGYPSKKCVPSRQTAVTSAPPTTKIRSK